MHLDYFIHLLRLAGEVHHHPPDSTEYQSRVKRPSTKMVDAGPIPDGAVGTSQRIEQSRDVIEHEIVGQNSCPRKINGVFSSLSAQLRGTLTLRKIMVDVFLAFLQVLKAPHLW